MASRFVFLIDTNVFIPVEPTACEHVEALTQPIADLERLIRSTENDLVVHPELFRDIGRDRDRARQRLRTILATKYPRLKRPPTPSETVEPTLGRVPESSHDWIDHHLLAAVVAGAVDFLVTEDGTMHLKARRLSVAERVLKVADALEMVRRLYESVPPTPPAVEKVDGRRLDTSDSIFNSLRCDYPGFDGWLAKVQRENRPAWAIIEPEDGYAGLCIVKEEVPDTYGMFDHVLKICTFKVSDRHEGYRFGELLLKALFDYAEANAYDWLYLTALPDKSFLLEYLADFGFEQRGYTEDGREIVLAKKRRYSRGDLEHLNAYSFHIRFGPPAAKWEGTPAFIVPIQPVYHERLFPEADPQVNLFSGHEPHGNAIRKAYLSRSNISLLQPGDLLYFYESRGGIGVSTAGVVEAVHLLSDPREIVRVVGKRTLYTFDEITRLTSGANPDVLAINFRQARVLDRPLKLDELVRNGVVTAAPQSIQTIPQRGASWIAQQTFQ